MFSNDSSLTRRFNGHTHIFDGEEMFSDKKTENLRKIPTVKETAFNLSMS